MNAADVMLGIGLGFCALRGWQQGLWRAGLRLFGGLAALAVARFGQPGFAAWLSQDPKRAEDIHRSFLKPLLDQVDPNLGREALVNLAQLIQQTHLPVMLKMQLVTELPGATGSVSTLNQIPLMLLSAGILFLGTLALVHLAVFLLDGLSALPGLNLGKRAGGALVGTAEGLVIIWGILLLLTVWIGFRPDGAVGRQLEASTACRWLYEHNGLLWVFKTYL